MKLLKYATMMATMVLLFQPAVNAQETLLGLDDNNNIISANSGTPTLTMTFAVDGLATGDNLVGIDYRSGNAQLYALGSLNNVYLLDRETFAATVVGNFADGVNDDPANVGPLSGNQFAFDFNPALTSAGQPRGSFARIISDTDVNRVISGNTGEYLGVEKTPVFYADGDENAGANPTDNNPAGNINIQGIAYDSSVFGTTSTTQFGIDVNQDAVATIANNAGTLVTVGDLGIDVTGDVGFDISGATGTAYATFTTGVNGTSELYTIDLDTGAATAVLPTASGFGTGNTIRSLTVLGPASVPEPSSLSLLALGAIAFAGRRRRK